MVVKVQRPGLKKLFDIDLSEYPSYIFTYNFSVFSFYHESLIIPFFHSENLKLVAEYFQRSESLGGPTRDWIGIYDECAK